MRLAATGQRVGDVQLSWTSEEHRQGEVGFITHPDHTGHSYATEAAQLVLHLGFDGFGLHRITASLDPRKASARVAQRLGMRQEAHLRHNALRGGEWTDEAVHLRRPRGGVAREPAPVRRIAEALAAPAPRPVDARLLKGESPAPPRRGRLVLHRRGGGEHRRAQPPVRSAGDRWPGVGHAVDTRSRRWSRSGRPRPGRRTSPTSTKPTRWCSSSVAAFSGSATQ